MSNFQTIKLNFIQNYPDFELSPFQDLNSLIFKKQLFSKTLDPAKKKPEKPENYRTVTIKCLYPNCR